MCDPGAGNALQTYYCQRFPAEELCELLAREWRGDTRLQKRELCIENVSGCYIRWQCVSNPAELRSLFKEKRVEKFHTGAIFSQEPRLKKKGVVLEPMEREFVVDIDVNDYDVWGIDANDIESCDYAWELVAFGMKMVKHVLTEHFGFSNVLLVYSGRRGAHMSVYDARACVLTDEARSAIVSYLQPGDKLGKSGRLSYSSILRSAGFAGMLASHVMPFWSSCCLKPRERGGMGVLDGPLEKEAFMELLGNKYAQETLSLSMDTGVEMWSKLTRFADESMCKESIWLSLQETVMCYLWPRLDGAVSVHRNHLSKSVFSIHPKTGRICLPIKGDSFLFKPSDCPTYTDLVNGVGAAEASFKAAVCNLQHFVKSLKSSRSESWSPPRLDVGTCKVYSMLSHKRGRAEHEERPNTPTTNKHCFRNRKRLYANATRVFYAQACNADPYSVSIFFYTTLPDPCVGEVLPGYSHPFRNTGAFPIHSFVDGVRKASANPGSEIVIDKAYTCVLFHPKHKSKQRCERRMQRLEQRLLYPNRLTTVKLDWRESLETIINDQVKEIWDTKYINFN